MTPHLRRHLRGGAARVELAILVVMSTGAAAAGACIVELADPRERPAPPPDASDEPDPCTSTEPGSCCEPGATVECYDGPAATQGVGACRKGARTCEPDGSAFGPCEGQVLPAVEDCASEADEDCDAKPCAGEVRWAKRFGGAGNQAGNAVVVDAEGNPYVAGTFDDMLELGPTAGTLLSGGNRDVFLMKMSPAGEVLWGKRLGGGGDDSAGPPGYGRFGAPLGINADSLVLTGSVSGSADLGDGKVVPGNPSDLFVAKFDLAGHLLWGKRFGSLTIPQLSISVAVADDGRIAIAGGLQGTVDFGGRPLTSSGDADAFVAVFDPAGVHLWSARFGDEARQLATDVAFDNSGHLVITGSFMGRLDDLGDSPPTSGGSLSGDIFLAQLDASTGAFGWAKRYGQNVTDDEMLSTALTADPEGGLALTGWFHGTLNFGGGELLETLGAAVFLARLSAEGDKIGVERCGNQYKNTVGWAVALDARQQVLATGNVDLTVPAEFGDQTMTKGADDLGSEPLTIAPVDAFAFKMDSDLSKSFWVRRIGGPQWQTGYGVAVDALGESVYTGRFQGDVTSIVPSLAHAGGDDIFVIKLGP